MSTTATQIQSNTRGLIRTWRQHNPLLFAVAGAHLALLLVMLVIAPFDARLVTGLNPWIKPMKFAASIAIFLLTMGWLLAELPAGARTKLLVSWVLAGTMITEIVLITMQAARGVGSHFNNSSPFNAWVFSLMGLAITINTLVMAYVALRFWRTGAPVPAPYLWGIRLGLTIFVLASLEGFVMVTHSAHSVGVPDGGAGLPVVNWSTTAGDLRVAHFFGMHALQVLPLIGYVLATRRGQARAGGAAVRWIQASGAGYAVIALLLFLWALAGRPLIAL